MLLDLATIAARARSAPPFIIWFAGAMFTMKPGDPRLETANRLYRRLKPCAQIAVRLELDYLRAARRACLDN